MPWIYESAFFNQAGAANQVTTKPGALKAIVVGTAVAGNVIVYDDAAANNNQVFAVNSNVVGHYPLDMRISNGLRVVYPANCALTVIYQ